MALPDVQPGQHGSRPAAKHPDGEEDDEQRGGEHHLASVGGRVSDGQGKRHRPAQTWGRGGGVEGSCQTVITFICTYKTIRPLQSKSCIFGIKRHPVYFCRHSLNL